MTDSKDRGDPKNTDAQLGASGESADADAASKYGPNASTEDDPGVHDDPLDAPRSSGGASDQMGLSEAQDSAEQIESAQALESSGASSKPEDSQGTTESSVLEKNETENKGEDSKRKEKKPGRALAFLAFLFALSGLAGVAYLYYLLIYLDPLQSVRASNQDLSQNYSALERGLQDRLTALETSNAEALAQVTASQEERLAANESAVIESLNEAINAAPPSQREWRIAEAEYLLRIANHRVLMEGDSKGGAALLEAADQIIEALDDFALHQVRARLADEIVALRQVPREDLQGLYLRLEALKSQTLALPFDSPEYLEPPTAPPPEQTVWQSMVDELKRFVRVRTLENDEAIKPLLAPAEEDYLALNLRLAFEQAQLAVLKRHQAVFELSLQSAREWVAQYMDPQSQATQAVLAELDALAQMNLEQELPDISGSLNELIAIGRSGS